jgi:hypothetical protein
LALHIGRAGGSLSRSSENDIPKAPLVVDISQDEDERVTVDSALVEASCGILVVHGCCG